VEPLYRADVETTTQTGALAGLQADITSHGHNVIRTQMARSSGMVRPGSHTCDATAVIGALAAAVDICALHPRPSWLLRCLA